jgi:tetratricopeptide (TPR) repeat protein
MPIWTDYDRAEKNGANKSVLAQVRGSLYFQMKDYDKAIADWKAFLAATPNAPETIHYNIGLAYLEKKQYDRAVEAFTAALQRKPRYAPALTARAEAYLSMEPKQYAKAKADAEAALLVDRDDEKAKRLLDQANAGLRLD